MDQYTNYLAHHGVLGMKWGVRRYQNKDGTLTAAGKKRADKDARLATKWATQENQPSSFKASVRAGIYAANPSKHNAKKLERANDADEARYKAARFAYEAKKKPREAYKEATDYADKHGLDSDWYVNKQDRKSYLKNTNNKELAKIVVKYSELMDLGSIKEERAYREGQKMIDTMNLNDFYIGDHGRIVMKKKS